MQEESRRRTTNHEQAFKGPHSPDQEHRYHLASSGQTRLWPRIRIACPLRRLPPPAFTVAGVLVCVLLFALAWWRGELLLLMIAPRVFFSPTDASCTPSSCLELSRCTHFSVYAPPDLPTRDLRSYQATCHKTVGNYAIKECAPHYGEVIELIRASPYYTDDPANACIIFPRLDGLCMYNKCNHPETLYAMLYRSLDTWYLGPKPGSHHLVLQFSDPSESQTHIDSALCGRSSWSLHAYRPQIDIALPLLGGRLLKHEHRIRSSRERSVLVSFKGSPYHGRSSLTTLHNDADVLIYERCPRDVDLSVDHPCKKYWERDFDELMIDSKFALVPSGLGLHSYRLREAMSAGAIPVILSEELVLPFSEILNWNEFSVSVSHAMIHTIPHLLRSIPEHVVERMHRTVCRVFERHFLNLETVLATTLEVYRFRYSGEGYTELFWNITSKHSML